jgi:hypothetical protein
MFLGMFVMFILMMAGGGGLAWLIWRRLAGHLKENPEAVAALTTHLFLPLLGKKEAPAEMDGERPDPPG